MLEMESEILCKAQFKLCRKISILWYLEAFAVSGIVFARPLKLYKKKKIDEQENKENLAVLLLK